MSGKWKGSLGGGRGLEEWGGRGFWEGEPGLYQIDYKLIPVEIFNMTFLEMKINCIFNCFPFSKTFFVLTRILRFFIQIL